MSEIIDPLKANAWGVKKPLEDKGQSFEKIQ